MLRVQAAPAQDGLPALVGRSGGAVPELRAPGQRREVGARPVGLQGHDGADQGRRGGEGEHVLARLPDAGKAVVAGLALAMESFVALPSCRNSESEPVGRRGVGVSRVCS